MERKHQLSNVAFGGQWSETIADRETRADALDALDGAAADSGWHDPLRPEVLAHLQVVLERHPKAAEMLVAWTRAGRIGEPSVRMAECQRVAKLLRAWAAG